MAQAPPDTMLAVHMSDSITEPSDEQIAILARKFWEEEGQPEGKAEEHWTARRTNSAMTDRANASRAARYSNQPARFPAPANVAEQKAIHVSHRP
jgi:hypothetical protein